MSRRPLPTPHQRSVRSAARGQRYRSVAIGAGLGLLVVMLAFVGLGAANYVVTRGHAAPRTPHAPGVSTASAIATPEPPPDPVEAAEAAAAAAERSAEATVSAEPSGTITVVAVGDMIFDRAVHDLISAKGADAPFSAVSGQLRGADIALGNLESVLSDKGSVDASKDATFRGDVRAVSGLANAGFDFVSLANNHALDYRRAALTDEIARLDAAGVAHAGAGANRSAAWAPATATRNGASIAYLAFTHVVPLGWQATGSTPGIASGRWEMDKVAAAIRSAKKTHDYVVVTFHWGKEYAETPNAEQVRNGHRAIDAGADLVVSSHPHVIQGIESYKGKLIAYSLGDFVFDHFSRKTGESFILTARLSPDGSTEATITPVYLDTNGRPQVVTGSEANSILTRLKALSAPLHGDVVIDGDTARIRP